MKCYESYNMVDRQWDSAGQPHFTGHLPGYTGYCPGRRYTEGLTFGAVTERINKKVRDEIATKFSEPRGPKCTAVARYSTCHGLPMSVYRERPQTGTVFTNKDEMDKLIDSLAWYSKSRKDRAYQGTNNILPHRYRIRTYNNNNQDAPVKREGLTENNHQISSRGSTSRAFQQKTSSGTQSEQSYSAVNSKRTCRVKV